jgi:uncharacterized membrane protein SpoIIM required for sporulation
VDERAYVDRRRPEWERLAEIIRRVSKPNGLRSLSGSELADLGKLYRRVTSDLAYVKANFVSEDIIIYLNDLAGRAHGLLYTDAPTGGIRSVVSFLLTGFPILFREKKRFIAISAAIMIVSAIFAAVVVIQNPATADRFIPHQFRDSSKRYETPRGSSPPSEHQFNNQTPATLSSFLMANNIRVSLLAFAGGITFGILTVYLLISNGMVLGAFLIRPYSFLRDPIDIIAFIFPHGVIELTAIVISAAAGLILGWSLVAPGNLSRWDSLKKASRDALPLMGGVVAMLVIAGCIESCVARTNIDRSIKLGFAIFSAIGLILYFGWSGRGRQAKEQSST